jgi:hypothetical protein
MPWIKKSTKKIITSVALFKVGKVFKYFLNNITYLSFYHKKKSFKYY